MKVEMYENQDFNGGPVQADRNGLRVFTDISIPDFSKIVVSKPSIVATRDGHDLPDGTPVDFSGKMSSFRVNNWNPGEVNFFHGENYTSSPFGGDRSADENLASFLFGIRLWSDNDKAKSVQISKVDGPEVIRIAELELHPNQIHIGDPFTLTLLLSRPAPSSGVYVGFNTSSDGSVMTLDHELASMVVSAGVRSVSHDFMTLATHAKPTYIDFHAGLGGSTPVVQARLTVLP